MTTRSLLDLWLDAKEAQGVSSNTLLTLKRTVTPFITFLEDTAIETVDAPKVREWLLLRRRKGISSHTLHNDYRSVKSFFQWLVTEELLEATPFTKILPPKKEHLLKPDLMTEEVELLLGACEGKHWFRRRDKALLLLLLDSGLRIHEAHRITARQASLETFTIKGKGGKERLVMLSGSVRVHLARYLRSVPFETGNTLWWGREGPLTSTGIRQVVYDIGQRAGLKPFGAHRLRRTFATWSLRNGMDLETLRRLMGHSSLTILQQYLNLVDNDLKERHHQFSPLRRLGRKA